jgi:hypothetical protein
MLPGEVLIFLFRDSLSELGEISEYAPARRTRMLLKLASRLAVPTFSFCTRLPSPVY